MIIWHNIATLNCRI